MYRDRLYRPGGQLAVAAGARFKEANNKDSGHKVKEVSNAVMFDTRPSTQSPPGVEPGRGHTKLFLCLLHRNAVP